MAIYIFIYTYKISKLNGSLNISFYTCKVPSAQLTTYDSLYIVFYAWIVPSALLRVYAYLPMYVSACTMPTTRVDSSLHSFHYLSFFTTHGANAAGSLTLGNFAST